MKKRLLSLLLVLVLAFSVLSFTSCQFFDKDCDHEWGQWVTMESPTIDKEGRAERTCLKCGEKESKTIAKINHTHTFGEWVVVKEATADENGIRERTCTFEGCNEKETQTFSLSSLTGNDGITAFKAPKASSGQTFAQAVAVLLQTPNSGTPSYTVSQYSNNTVIINGQLANYSSSIDNQFVCSLTYLGTQNAVTALVEVYNESTNKYVENEELFQIDDNFNLIGKKIENKQYKIQIKWTYSTSTSSATRTSQYTLDFTNVLLCRPDNFLEAIAITNNPSFGLVENSNNPEHFSYESVFLSTEDYSMSNTVYTVTQYDKTFVIDGEIPYIIVDPDEDNSGFAGSNYVVGILFKTVTGGTDTPSINASEDRKLKVSNESTAKLMSNLDILKVTGDDGDESEVLYNYFVVYWKLDPFNSTKTITISADMNPEAYVAQTYTLKLADTVIWEDHDDGFVRFAIPTSEQPPQPDDRIAEKADGESSDADQVNGVLSQIGNTIYVQGGSYPYYNYKVNGKAIGWLVPLSITGVDGAEITSLQDKSDIFIPKSADLAAANIDDFEYDYDYVFVKLSSNAKEQTRTVVIGVDGVQKTYTIKFNNINCLGYVDNFAEFSTSDSSVTIQQYGTSVIVSGTIPYSDKDEIELYSSNPKGNYVTFTIANNSDLVYYNNTKVAKVKISGSSVSEINKEYTSSNNSEMFSTIHNGTIKVAIPVSSASDKVKIEITWDKDAPLTSSNKTKTYTISFGEITLAKE